MKSIDQFFWHDPSDSKGFYITVSLIRLLSKLKITGNIISTGSINDNGKVVERSITFER